MTHTAKKFAGVAGSALLLTSLGATSAVALAEESADQTPAAATQSTQDIAGNTAQRSYEVVEGTFSFTQGDVTSTDTIAQVIGKTAAYLCGSSFIGGEAGNAAEWRIAVSGDVENAFVAPLGELEESGEAHMILGCSCAGNPEDGLASVNAEVTGVTIAHILERAQPAEGANTIVFTSADGYEVALPLSYVAQRASMIAYAVNGAELGDSVGGTNQLWLGSTAANYFVRNVESIAIESRESAPAAPGSPEAGDTYANVPNISVVYGGAAA